MEKLQYIAIGDLDSPSFEFEGDDILSTSGDFSVDMIGAELCTDSMDVEVSYNDVNGNLRALPWATPVYFYMGASLEGKMYSVSVTRIGKKTYRIRTTSAAGIMEYDKFYGNLYTGQYFRSVVEQIIGTNGLQPYEGVYSRYLREKDDTTAPIQGFFMGSYADQAKTVAGDGAFLSATMSSKLSAKVKIFGFSNESYDLYVAQGGTAGTSYRCRLLGASCDSNSAEDIQRHRYGLFMDMTRASTGVPFPAFGDVIFVCGRNAIDLGTPASSSEAVYEIEVDPAAGTAKINGTTHTLTMYSELANDAAALHVYGGGAHLYDSSGTRSAIQPHHCEVEYDYYVVEDQSGHKQANFVGVRNIFTYKKGIYDYVSQKLQPDCDNSVVLANDLTPYDVATYGDSMLFNNRTDFQTDVLDNLSYAEGIDSIRIYGWLPICSKREALQQVLFATGVILIKDAQGVILFTAPSTQAVKTIDDDEVYDQGSEDQPEHTNTVELTEHAYILDQTAELASIYEKDESLDKYYIAPFSTSPAKLEASTGLTVVYANCNAAVVSGAGKLTGHPYYHGETVLKREIARYPDGSATGVSDATLVTALNSTYVLDRLAAFYSAAHKTHVDIVQNGERCGLTYSLTSAFMAQFSGFLVRASKTFTSIIKANCEFVQGYTPPEFSSWYMNYIILTGSGTWTVPASVFEKETPRIRVVLIGGGRGGNGGYAGVNGLSPSGPDTSGTRSGGGLSGNSGTGGKVYEFTIYNPAASYEYSCGQGGAGGGISHSDHVSNPGSDGGDTVLTGDGQTYSSADGETRENGVANSITGERYAGRLIRSWNADTNQERTGGHGGRQLARPLGVATENAAGSVLMIQNTIVERWNGGANGPNYYRDRPYISAAGGGGGGAAWGQNGSPGSAAYTADGVNHSGNGGKGGDAILTPPKATDYNPAYYGYGGLGGGGGGGGGAGGWVWGGSPYAIGSGGAGGYGGKGGDGGDGCVLIYY